MNIYLIFWSTFIMFIWFNTDAFIWWSKLFNLNKFFLIDNWENYRVIDSKMSYLDYLFMIKKNFFTKLISCKPCMLFWIVIFLSIFEFWINWISHIESLVIKDIPILFIGSYFLYSLFSFSIKKLSIC